VFAAQAKVKEHELNLGYTTIESPVTGLASRSAQRQGAYINAQSESAKLTYVAALDPIWDRVRTEAEDIVRREPELASFIYSTVLHHDRLEDSVTALEGILLSERSKRNGNPDAALSRLAEACRLEHLRERIQQILQSFGETAASGGK